MKKISLGFAFLLFAFYSLFSANAFAQAGATGFDLIGGLYVPVLDQDVKFSGGNMTTTVTSEDPMVGIGGAIAFGYKWQYIGVYVQQDLGGVWLTGDDADAADKTDSNYGWFLGGTYAVLRGMYPVNSQFQVDVGVGLGVMYGDGDDAKDGLKKDYKFPLISDKHGDPSAAFAMKFAFSGTYYFAGNMGVGLMLDYNLGVKTYKDGGIEVKRYLHQVNPGFHFRMNF